MLFHFGRAFLVLGWVLTIAGVSYVVVGVRHMGGATGASPAFLLIGLVAVVVGSSIIRWVRRER